MTWKITRSIPAFLGHYSSGNSIQIRVETGKLLVTERTASQLWMIGFLLSFGIYLAYVLFFHFEKINGGAFGVSVLAIGSLIGLVFGAKNLVKFYRLPAVEFDLLNQTINFLSCSRFQRSVSKSVLFANVESVQIQETKVLNRRSSTEVFVIELTLYQPKGEILPVCVSGDRNMLEEILELLSKQTRFKIVMDLVDRD